jgi:peptidoglycan/LPS O-acetylase OafA/YrhL
MEERLHLKGLNGLRAIAAISVVIQHVELPGLQFSYLWPQFIGNYAVTVFFTLSGFLITLLLLKEKDKTEISIRKFYIRRMLRIWPLYFLYLVIVVTVFYLPGAEKLTGILPYYLLFAANIPNIMSMPLPLLRHYWSLGAEEQFYLFWPWLIKKSKNNFKSILLFIILIFVLKAAAHLISIKYHTVIFVNILDYTRFECMAIGAMGACLYLQKNKIFLWITANRFTEIICWLYLCLTVYHGHIRMVNHDTVSLVTVCLIVNINFNKRAFINLDNRVFNFLGRISYGIYIIHPLIMYALKQLLPMLNMPGIWEQVFFSFTVLLLTICVSWLSYHFFEKRFLLLKERFTVIKNTV